MKLSIIALATLLLSCGRSTCKWSDGNHPGTIQDGAKTYKGTAIVRQCRVIALLGQYNEEFKEGAGNEGTINANGEAEFTSRTRRFYVHLEP